LTYIIHTIFSYCHQQYGGVNTRYLVNTRSSADADKPARLVYSGYGFLLVFYRNFVPSTHRFWDIRLQ